jgi:hypothetical protein
MSRGDELKLQRCAAATRNESKETRTDSIVIMHLDAMAVVPENPQSFSTVHSFEQGQVAVDLRSRDRSHGCIIVSIFCYTDQRAQVRIDLWPTTSRSGLPTPVMTKTRAAPSHQGLRSDDPKRIQQSQMKNNRSPLVKRTRPRILRCSTIN